MILDYVTMKTQQMFVGLPANCQKALRAVKVMTDTFAVGTASWRAKAQSQRRDFFSFVGLWELPTDTTFKLKPL